jgi:chromate transporter
MKGLHANLSFLAVHFAILSLLAFGGVNTIIPEIHRQSVDVMGWMSDRQFADLFAIAQAAPGPNTLIVTLIGWRVAGLAGAVVATLAMCGPAALLTYVAIKLWNRFKNAPWRSAAQRGVASVTIGLVGASAFVLTRATAHGPMQLAVTGASSILAYASEINPLWILGGAAVLGLAGVLGSPSG